MRLRRIICGFALLLFLFSSDAFSQVRRPTIEGRQAELRSVRRESARKADRIEINWKLIADDFKALQVQNENLYKAAHSSEPDYGLIKTIAGQLKKCAERLKTNLALPESDATSVNPSTPSTNSALQATTKTLNEQVADFVSSPLFDSVGTVNVQQATAAHDTLERIVKLSQSIRKGAANLKNQ